MMSSPPGSRTGPGWRCASCTCNAHSRGYYAAPKWLFDAGCKGFEYLRGGDDPTSGGQRIPRIEPDYADPSYLARHGAFIEELGRRYDGHPGVEFIDIGSYGIWGEWPFRSMMGTEEDKLLPGDELRGRAPETIGT